MSKKNRERRTNESGVEQADGGGSSLSWLPIVLAVGALVLGFLAWTDAKNVKVETAKRLVDVDQKLLQLQTQVANAAKAKPAAQQGPDPNKVYTVKTDGSPTRGNPNAPIVIAQFSDYQCPFCSRVEPTMAQIEKVYGDKVKVVWKNLPLSFHPNAMPAALAAMAANDQGKFWEFHDKVFANQQKLSRDQYVAYAKELKLDVPKFSKALDDAAFKAAIEADSKEANALGVSGTPAFFVNGKFLSGAKPFAEFATAINAELKRLNLPIPPGAPSS